MFKLFRQVRARAAAAALCALAAFIGHAPAPAHAADSAAPADAEYAQRVLHTLNAYRAEKGLPALQHSPALSALAAMHSGQMAARRRLSHDGFTQRFESTGADLCVENVAHGFRVPEQVLSGWRRVSTHHRNLLEPRVSYVGVANNGLFVTYFACDTPR